ncbi:MAG: non-homologous end-joining DNA ligase [Planctomycetota bacterium]
MAKKLSDYERKRDFAKTPEPAVKTVTQEPASGSRGDRRVFVVHRHDASSLHYDLRLEDSGVLKSWAVPRGFSYEPSEKRLAVHTEDHPLEYEDFDGVIPKGQYGGGTMLIWDRGTYELLKAASGEAAITAGEVKIQLDGKRLRGEWHLVRTQKEPKSWLLFKARDCYARATGEVAYPFGIDLDRAQRREPSSRLTPMRPQREVDAFSDPDWLYEMEFAGVRAFLFKDGGNVWAREAGGRRVHDLRGSLRVEAGKIHAQRATLDGVLVALDASQRPCREALARALADEKSSALYYYAFDLLHFDAWQLHKLPLTERKQLLAAVVSVGRSLLYVDHVRGEGGSLANVVAAAGLPGVIAKRAAGPYRGGASADWRRIPIATQDEPRGVGVLERIENFAAEGARTRVKLTNRSKVLFPEAGYTKGDFVAFYDRVAEVLLPYLRDRPLHMNRFPDGIHGKSFYHKDAPDHTPDWVRTETIQSRGEQKAIRYVICNDRDTLLYLANLGSIDLHPWLSHLGSLDTPDWLVFDLDPDGSPFPHVVRIARSLGKLLHGIGLHPRLKTSGASGLHVYVSVLPHYSYDQVRMFGEAIARYVAREHAEVATVERSVASRRGKVYIDFLQNRRGQTVVPPYVVRPVAAASVSTPLDWDELSSRIEPQDFHIGNVPERVATLGDLFRPTLTDPEDLVPAIAAFERIYLNRGAGE